MNTDIFIERAIKIHGNKYNYMNSIYISSHKKIDINCKLHGKFSQIASNHLNGAGCSKCAVKEQHDIQRGNLKEFMNKSNKVHENKYDYSIAKYKGRYTKICIICKNHGMFLQTPSNHMNGHGCPRCKSEKISNVNRNRILDSETKIKMRTSAIKRIERHKLDGSQLIPAFNKNACKIIEEYGKKNGYNFQHAMNGGEYHIKELGYWVDGYDKEKNIVIEIDEKRHFDVNGNLKIKDVNRMNEIKRFLNCRFIRLRFEENINAN